MQPLGDVAGGDIVSNAYGISADSVMNGTGKEAFDAIRQLKAADAAQYEPANGADYPRGAFGQALKQIAQLTKANLGLEVAFADIGGWDTHVNQGPTQGQLGNRLDDFSRGIAALGVLITLLARALDPRRRQPRLEVVTRSRASFLPPAARRIPPRRLLPRLAESLKGRT